MGNTYTETTIVNVIDRNTIDTLLKAKWEGMKGALINSDMEGSLKDFLSDSQSKYRLTFTMLKGTIATIASNMQNIELAYAVETIAKYKIKREQLIDGQQQVITYYIYFAKGRNGLWKIDEF